VKKWSKDSAREGHKDNQINVIWFCVEGTSSKLLPKTMKDLSRATSMWETVPVIVVITKSYSTLEREQNIEMVSYAFAKQKRYSKNLRKVIPVVASTYVLNDNAYAAPEGITELIDATNELMPEGIRAGEIDIATFKLNRKRTMAHGITMFVWSDKDLYKFEQKDSLRNENLEYILILEYTHYRHRDHLWAVIRN